MKRGCEQRAVAILECKTDNGRSEIFRCCAWGCTVNKFTRSEMKTFLGGVLSTANNDTKIGLYAENEFRKHIAESGYGNQLSNSGWIARNTINSFSTSLVAIFPETIYPEVIYPPLSTVRLPHKLHTICATFHQTGIWSYYAYPNIDGSAIEWKFKRLGVPTDSGFISMDDVFSNFRPRTKRYNFLRNKSDADKIPDYFLPEEFSKEHLRVSIQSQYMTELSDIDGIFWGQRLTYPIEVKEKVVGFERNVGNFFGIDVGPFVKLAFYASKRGNLHSLFVVRQINDRTDRNLVAWRYITFEKLAQYASWVPMGGGMNMQGGSSTVIKIPEKEFGYLDSSALEAL